MPDCNDKNTAKPACVARGCDRPAELHGIFCRRCYQREWQIRNYWRLRDYHREYART